MKLFSKIFAAVAIVLLLSPALQAATLSGGSMPRTGALGLLSMLFVLGAVLGMRGSGSYATPDERPKNYRDQILLLYPNSAPLLAMTSKLKSEKTDDPEFKVLTKGLPVQRVIVSGSQSDSDTTIELTGSGTGTVLRAGMSLINERTLEIIWVGADPTTPFNQFTAVRGKGQVAGAAMNDLDGLLVIGSHSQEGAAAPTAISYAPNVISNYTQIFRDPIFITGTGAATNMRYGKPKVELKREALETHGMGIEKAFLFGGQVEDTTGSQPERTTKGLLNFISSNIFDGSGGVTISGWELFLEGVFKFGSRNKVLFAGARLITVANAMARAHTQITAVPTTESYGVQMNKWLTPFGDVMLINHPLLANNPTFTSWGFLVDMKYVVYRFLIGRDTDYYENIQNPDQDAVKDEFKTECGLELDFEESCGVVKTATSFVP
jgi:hypothetical protein